MDLRLDVRTLKRVLVVGVIFFAALGLAVELIALAVASPHLRGLVPLFSLSQEANLPTWWQSGVLVGASLVLGAIGSVKRKQGAPFARHWVWLAYIFYYLALDEFASIHEQMDQFFPYGGVLYFSWIVPFSVLVLVFAASYLKFLLHLPRRYQILFAVAGVIYVGGALVMEMPLGWWAERHGTDDLVYVIMDWSEETLEMIGAAIFLSAVAEIFHEQVKEVRIKSASS